MEAAFDYRLLRDCQFCVVEPQAIDWLPDLPATPLVPAVMGDSAHLMPRLVHLVDLTQRHAAALLESIDTAQLHKGAPPVMLFVKAACDPARFSRHWNQIQIHRTGPDSVSWLRAHDPRVLHQLLRILAPAQTAYLLGPASEVVYWLGGEWLHAANPLPMQYPSVSNAAWDWGRVERIGLVNRAFARAGVFNAGQVSALSPRVESLLARATGAHGLRDDDDLVEFASRGIVSRPEFEQHPSVLAMIRGTGPDDESTLADRFARVEPAVWADLSQAENRVDRR